MNTLRKNKTMTEHIIIQQATRYENKNRAVNMEKSFDINPNVFEEKKTQDIINILLFSEAQTKFTTNGSLLAFCF